MSYFCKQCKSILPATDFSKEERIKIRGMIFQNKKMLAIDSIRKTKKLDLKEAKGLIMHLNKEYGKCANCGYSELELENIECPKCKSFNYNWNIKINL